MDGSNCSAVECDFNDGRDCIWIKNGNCGPRKDRVYSESYRTCTEDMEGNAIFTLSVYSINLQKSAFGLL